MVTPNKNIYLLAGIMIILGNLVYNKYAVGEEDRCDSELLRLLGGCAEYVQMAGSNTPPSITCCDTVKNVNITCICQRADKVQEDVISSEKIVYVAGYCGTPLPHHIKCGTYTVP